LFAEKGHDIHMVYGDAAQLPFKKGSFDGVLVFYLLIRDTMRDLVSLLKDGGILIYETFLKRQNEFDRWRNPDFLLDDGELISYFRDMNILFYEETTALREGKKRATARFVGMKR